MYLASPGERGGLRTGEETWSVHTERDHTDRKYHPILIKMCRCAFRGSGDQVLYSTSYQSQNMGIVDPLDLSYDPPGQGVSPE